LGDLSSHISFLVVGGASASLAARPIESAAGIETSDAIEPDQTCGLKLRRVMPLPSVAFRHDIREPQTEAGPALSDLCSRRCAIETKSSLGNLRPKRANLQARSSGLSGRDTVRSKSGRLTSALPQLRLSWAVKVPLVVTAHDGGLEAFPDYHPREWRIYVNSFCPAPSSGCCARDHR